MCLRVCLGRIRLRMAGNDDKLEGLWSDTIRFGRGGGRSVRFYTTFPELTKSSICA